MPAWWRSSVEVFLNSSDSEILGVLSRAHAEFGYAAQLRDATQAWTSQLEKLRATFHSLTTSRRDAEQWHLLLEFVVPRKGSRIDALLLVDSRVLLLEFKGEFAGAHASLQADEYALLMHYFHQPSANRKIFPIVVADSMRPGASAPQRQRELALADTAAYWIHPTLRTTWRHLADAIDAIASQSSEGGAMDPEAFDRGEYFPVPSIIEAARALQSGLGIREIAHSRAARHDVLELSSFVHQQIQYAKRESKHVICFVTGVPGSGKTLVGLNLAFESRGDGDALHFMSGNAPLVQVMQSVFTDHQRKMGQSAANATIQAKTLIENVHLFAKEYSQIHPHATPSNHVVIFDEAQRAWNYEQSKRKFKRDTSEPTMFLQIMERHQDWAVIVALVGGGQEINLGEAGLAEWGRALAEASRCWEIVASPDALDGGSSVAGTSLLEDAASRKLNCRRDSRLHLDVSVRSLDASSYAAWVNAVIAGDSKLAAATSTGGFPVHLTRDVHVLRERLRQQRVGESRIGLVGSSKASRLRAEGFEPDGAFHKEYPWDRWYLASSSDVRSSDQLEVFATEFEIQGLELDWVGLMWGGDLIWCDDTASWQTRRLIQGSSTKWSKPNKGVTREYRLNSYRVLLTRARQGVILFVPMGDKSDPTRNPEEFHAVARFLLDCGVSPIGDCHCERPKERGELTLFT